VLRSKCLTLLFLTSVGTTHTLSSLIFQNHTFCLCNTIMHSFLIYMISIPIQFIIGLVHTVVLVALALQNF
jgi:hypothetical protein